MRQNVVQTAVQTSVVDFAFVDRQQIVKRSRWIPTLLDGQFTAGAQRRWIASKAATREQDTSADSPSAADSQAAWMSRASLSTDERMRGLRPFFDTRSSFGPSKVKHRYQRSIIEQIDPGFGRDSTNKSTSPSGYISPRTADPKSENS